MTRKTNHAYYCVHRPSNPGPPKEQTCRYAREHPWNGTRPRDPPTARSWRRKTSDFELDGNTHRASKDEPQYVVESAKTGARAAHKASALTEKD